MKIKILNWINFVIFFVCIAAAIINFCAGDIVNIIIGIFNIILSIFNLFIFLEAVARWWRNSDFVLDNFVFTCPKCGQKQIPSFWEWFFVPHIGSKRYLKCQDPACGKRSWMRRK